MKRKFGYDQSEWNDHHILSNARALDRLEFNRAVRTRPDWGDWGIIKNKRGKLPGSISSVRRESEVDTVFPDSLELQNPEKRAGSPVRLRNITEHDLERELTQIKRSGEIELSPLIIDSNASTSAKKKLSLSDYTARTPRPSSSDNAKQFIRPGQHQQLAAAWAMQQIKIPMGMPNGMPGGMKPEQVAGSRRQNPGVRPANLLPPYPSQLPILSPPKPDQDVLARTQRSMDYEIKLPTLDANDTSGRRGPGSPLPDGQSRNSPAMGFNPNHMDPNTAPTFYANGNMKGLENGGMGPMPNGMRPPSAHADLYNPPRGLSPPTIFSNPRSDWIRQTTVKSNIEINKNTISKDNTTGEESRKASLLAHFGRKYQRSYEKRVKSIEVDLESDSEAGTEPHLELDDKRKLSSDFASGLGSGGPTGDVLEHSDFDSSLNKGRRIWNPSYDRLSRQN